ncbi:MAG: PH domain-containing protein [bacterium]|nr:PH domain-containing protein [bacterium]
MAEKPKGKLLDTGPEREVGVWRRSRWTWSFWWRTVITLSLYYWTLWRRNQITVTTRRITQRRGNLIGGEETSVSLENVTDISLDEPLFGAIFNYGNITIQSAGSSSAEISFQGLGRAKKLRDVVFDLKDGRWDETRKR